MFFRLATLASLCVLCLLTAALGLTACNPTGSLGDDDDVITPPNDDDAADDDDDAADDDDDDDDDDDAPGTLSFDPSEVGAGDFLWVNATWENFALTDQTSICCASDEVVTLSSRDVAGNSVPVLMFFGLHSEGSLDWGLDDGQGTQVVGTFEVSALGEIPTIAPGVATTSASIDETGGFNVFAVEVDSPGTIVTARAQSIAPADFHPWFLVTGEDGFSLKASHGWYNEETQQEPFVSWIAQEAGTYYLRVQDNAQQGGHTYGYDLDLGFTAMTAPQQITDTEPNDSGDDFQDLGTLAAGGYKITGTAETAGHANNSDLNGDQDVYTFTLAEEALVYFSLEWATNDDFDAVVYDYNDGEIELGFGSEDAISTAMASTENPETVTLELAAGSYALQVGNWEGDPDAAYAVNVWVLPSHVTEP